MIAVTGAAGFIGGRIAAALAERGYDVLAVDHAPPDRNGDGPRAADAATPARFLAQLESGTGRAPLVEAVVHEGACVDTTLRDWGRMRAANVEYAARLLQASLRRRIPFVYASSAAVYGARPGPERPLTEYGRSKLLFDRYVRRILPAARSPVVGLRYFNVYGVGESHKGAMASIVFQLARQLELGRAVRLFAGCGGFADGEQRRDFVAVEDVVRVNLWFLEAGGESGIYDVGTSTSVTFNRVAELVTAARGGGSIEYVPFPSWLRGRYQTHTRADVVPLRRAGYTEAFTDVEEGVPRYVAALGSRVPA